MKRWSTFHREVRSDFRTSTFDPTDLRRLTKEISKTIQRNKALRFDSIAFHGLSGALVVPMLACKLNKQIIAVRDDQTVDGYYQAARYIIVDDWMETGRTVNRIIRAIHRDSRFSKPKLVAIILYFDGWLTEMFNCKLHGKVKAFGING